MGIWGLTSALVKSRATLTDPDVLQICITQSQNIWKCQWKGSIYFAHDSNRSCGVSILVEDSLEFDLKSILADDNGRYILLNTTVQGCNYFFGNVYGPNKVREQCSFFEELEKKIDDFIADENHRIIIGGDFNVVNDPDLDCSGGTPKEEESSKFLNSICLNYDLRVTD